MPRLYDCLPLFFVKTNIKNYFYRRQAIIVIPPAHVLAFSEECDVTKEQAELLLRKHGGNFKAALSAYIKGI